MQKASYLRPKEKKRGGGGRKKKKTLSRLLSMPGFLSSSLLASTPGGAAERSCLCGVCLAPDPFSPSLRVLRSPRGGWRREPGTRAHLAPVWFPPSIQTPGLKMVGGGGGDLELSRGPEGCLGSEDLTTLHSGTGGWGRHRCFCQRSEWLFNFS